VRAAEYNLAMQFRLRTLLVLVALLPIVIWLGWAEYAAYRARQLRRQADEQMRQELEKLSQSNLYPNPPHW
jgi:cell division protein FtsB